MVVVIYADGGGGVCCLLSGGVGALVRKWWWCLSVALRQLLAVIHGVVFAAVIAVESMLCVRCGVSL